MDSVSILLVVIIGLFALIYFSVLAIAKYWSLIRYNSIPLFLMAAFISCFLIYIDEGVAGWKNFNDPGDWIFIVFSTSIFFCLFAGLYILVNKDHKPKLKLK